MSNVMFEEIPQYRIRAKNHPLKVKEGWEPYVSQSLIFEYNHSSGDKVEVQVPIVKTPDYERVLGDRIGTTIHEINTNASLKLGKKKKYFTDIMIYMPTTYRVIFTIGRGDIELGYNILLQYGYDLMSFIASPEYQKYLKVYAKAMLGVKFHNMMKSSIGYKKKRFNSIQAMLAVRRDIKKMLQWCNHNIDDCDIMLDIKLKKDIV